MMDNILSREEISLVQQQIVEIKSECLDNNVSDLIVTRLEKLQSIIEKGVEKQEANISLTAQVSLYPLGQTSLTPTINEALEIFKKNNLDVDMGSMSTLVVGADNQIWKSLQEVFNAATKYGETVMIVTISNACPLPVDQSDSS